MHLKSFSTYGFKSFADKTELSFTQGITAIVGPNGSGKSNISDAIRWVLGEQSAKYLRGSKMEDVIFSGSGKRRALGVAEVTLNFDNSDHSLPLDFEEVSLTRRIFRSGDTDYQINKKNCRLKDILDLMADTGLGKGSMSIIGQNKIDEILNSRPEERRAIFEEAAGIAKYRLRKKEATRRLDATAENLTRINDIKSEVDKQVGPLYLAAEKTKQYNALNAELVRYHLTGVYHKLNNLEAQKTELESRKQELETQYAEEAAVLSTKEAELTQIQLEIDQLTESYTKLQEELTAKETQLAKLQGEKGVLSERISQSQRSSQRLEERNERLNTQADELEKQQSKLALEFDSLENARAIAELKVKELTKARDEQAQSLASIQSKSADEQSTFFVSMQELLKLRNDLHALEQQQEQRARQRDALKQNIEECESILSGLESQFQDILEQVNRKDNELDTTRKQFAKLQQEVLEQEKELRNLSQKQQECQRRLMAAETRAQTLRKLQQAYEGFGAGIRIVLKSQEPWRANIVGVAAELIQVPEQYVAALETALGEGAQNIVTRDAQTAKQAIGYLKSQNAGRATFLPLDTVQKRYPNAEEQRLTKLSGVCGFATDLITINSEAEAAIRFLLGRVLIAENIDAALAAAKAGHYRLRVVTLDGDVVNAGGSMTGGSRRHKEGYLSREQEIKLVQQATSQLQQEMLQCQEKVEGQEDSLRKLRKQLQEAENLGQQQKLKRSELILRQKQLEQDRARENESLMLYMDRRSKTTSDYMANRDKVKELRTSLQAKEQEDQQAKEQLENLRKETARINSQLTATTNLLQDAQVTLETSTAKTQLMSDSMHKLDKDALEVRAEIRSNQQEIERLAQVISTSEAEIVDLDAQAEDFQADLAKIVAGKDDFINDRSRLVLAQDELENVVREQRANVQRREFELQQLALQETKQTSDYEHLLEQLQEDYQLDREGLLQQDLKDLLELDAKDVQRQEAKLQSQIAHLGPINQAAIEEYQAVKERSEFLQKQYDDLTTAKNDLETVIAQINVGMSKRFKEAFVEINTHFAKCYTKLFGGGTALLKLNNDDILTAGIEIEAQPPGKKLQSLYLLSGGERALTVIALLFALLSYQPSPFCILDEIDAPLDDANILRFSDFLREFTAKTQFIVITHRKGTMESADIMYGVTMEESGVSKLLSVKINEKD